MAKKKAEPIEGEISQDDFVKRIRNEVEKTYGANICITGHDIVNRDLKIIPWSYNLDGILGGGVTEGVWISVAGAPKLGKTGSILKLCANAQKLGKTIYFLGPEGRLKKKDLVNVQGLDLSPDKFVPFVSTPEKILSSQDYLHIAETILKTHMGCVLVIDSISALADEKQLNDGFETEMRGKDYQTIGRFINNLGQFVSASKSIVIGTVHKIANTSGMGASSQDRVCNRFKFQADIRLDAKYMEKWKSGEEIVGQIIHWSCTSSALGRPYLETESYLRYGIGLDNTFEMMKAGEACGLISKGGAWYKLDYLEEKPDLLVDGESPKLQGGENVRNYLNSNPLALEFLTQKLSGIANQSVINSSD